jgi:thioredoxin reductase
MEANDALPESNGGDRFDVVIVGGGPAGLSAALTLARARRSVIVLDAGEPRNAPAAHLHGYLTRDGTPPAAFLAAGRAEVASYGGTLVDGHATAAQRAPDGTFTVSLGDGPSVQGRRLLVTTGLVDELPDIDGLAARWGRDVLHCPYCHGWEVRDQAIVVIATGPMGVHQAGLFRQWSSDVTMVLHRGAAPTDVEREGLLSRGVRLIEGRVAAVVVHDGRIVGVRLDGGAVLPAAAVVVAPRVVARSEVLRSLGLEAVEDPSGIGTSIPADPLGATSVAGVWVAGNVADVRGQVVHAAAAGTWTGAAINADLVAEDTARAVEARRGAAIAR